LKQKFCGRSQFVQLEKLRGLAQYI